LIGNDLVDLRAREAGGKSRDARFVARVFTARERELVARSPDPDHTLWMLWAAKEAAYKVAKKLSPAAIFAHARYEVVPDDAALVADDTGRPVFSSGHVLLRGIAGLDGARFPVRWSTSAAFVHCIAMSTEGDFGTLRVAIAACEAPDRDAPRYDPTERERASLLPARSSESIAARRLARALAAEAGLGEVEIVRERNGPVFGPPRLYRRGGTAPLAGWDVTLSHDGALAAAVLGASEVGT